jgi:hypothetical protein
MYGERRGRRFNAHGSDHYTLRDGRISEVRQYWVLDRDCSDTGLIGYPYPEPRRARVLGPHVSQLSGRWLDAESRDGLDVKMEAD